MATNRIHLAPNAVRVLRRQGSRIGRLEQRDPTTDEGPDPATVVFTLPGFLGVLAVSSPYFHPTGGLLVSARCKLGNPDSAIATEILFARNGVPIAPVHSWSGTFDSVGTPVSGSTTLGRTLIQPGHREAVAFFRSRRFAPNLDDLVVAVASTGEEAYGLTVRTDWGG